jgi:hypothetical protein
MGQVEETFVRSFWKEKRNWIVPEFSTTGDDERIAAGVVWLGAPPASFSFRCTACNHPPSVTLIGHRRDWQEIHRRVDSYLGDLGSEPKEFARLLMPVLEFFLKSFDEPDSLAVSRFWTRMVHHEDLGSKDAYISGWITAFCFWEVQGNTLQNRVGVPEDLGNLDGFRHHRVDTKQLPGGYASLPVTVSEGSETFQGRR